MIRQPQQENSSLAYPHELFGITIPRQPEECGLHREDASHWQLLCPRGVAKEAAHTSFAWRLCSGSLVVSWMTPKPLECGDPDKLAVLTASSRMRQFLWPHSDPIRLIHLFLLNHECSVKHFPVTKYYTFLITSSNVWWIYGPPDTPRWSTSSD